MPPIPPIVKNPHNVLRRTAREVAISDIQTPAIRKLLLRMEAALRASKDGVGIAAPQIGESVRVFLVSEEALHIDTGRPSPETEKDREERKERTWKYFVYINPVVKKVSRDTESYPEGCLSVPGVFGIVKRPRKIIVDAYDETGKKFTRGASKFFARVIQHELDHINGTLFIDKATTITEQNND